MNKARRTNLKFIANALSRINDVEDKAELEGLYNDLEDLKSEEEEYYDSIPENLQGGMRAMDSEAAIDNMDEALSLIEDAMGEENWDQALELIEEAIDLVEEATF